MRLRDGLGAATVSAASIGVGAISVGPEGPVVHLAATIASWLSKRFTLSRSMTLLLSSDAV
ncbi:MAG TPA: hypothetical protein EYM43_04690 [Alphaproteobacteria bacterium]|nr:hypothetical protein [Alphaproteobacteria bacterium]